MTDDGSETNACRRDIQNIRHFRQTSYNRREAVPNLQKGDALGFNAPGRP